MNKGLVIALVAVCFCIVISSIGGSLYWFRCDLGLGEDCPIKPGPTPPGPTPPGPTPSGPTPPGPTPPGPTPSGPTPPGPTPTPNEDFFAAEIYLKSKNNTDGEDYYLGPSSKVISKDISLSPNNPYSKNDAFVFKYDMSTGTIKDDKCVFKVDHPGGDYTDRFPFGPSTYGKERGRGEVTNNCISGEKLYFDGEYLRHTNGAYLVALGPNVSFVIDDMFVNDYSKREAFAYKLELVES